MQKFEDIDIIETLRQIMLINTEHFTDDFDYDIKAIRKAAHSDKAEDKNLLWLSRFRGTHCFYENDVYIKNTSANITWKHWIDNKSETPIAYAVKIKYMESGKVLGDLYQLDYEKSIEQVNKYAVKADKQILHYEFGDEITDFGKYISADDHKTYGKFVSLAYVPNNGELLKSNLRSIRRERNEYPTGDIESHINDLMKSAVSNKILTMTAAEKEIHIGIMEHSESSDFTPLDYAIYKELLKTGATEQKPSIKNQLKADKENTPKKSKQTKEDISL